jgi:hypothetical protein
MLPKLNIFRFPVSNGQVVAERSCLAIGMARPVIHASPPVNAPQTGTRIGVIIGLDMKKKQEAQRGAEGGEPDRSLPCGKTMKKTMILVFVLILVVVVVALITVGAVPVYAHGHVHGSIWIGPGWGPWWGYPGYQYPYYPYPYYGSPPVVIQQQPPIYEDQSPQQEQEQPYYWYYCPDSKTYYPYVKQCPSGWLKVVPTPAPSK